MIPYTSTHTLGARDGISAPEYQASLGFQQLLRAILRLAHITEAFLVLIVVSVVLRMYTRLKITRQFGVEDWTMAASSIFALAQGSLTIASCYLVIGLFEGSVPLHVYNWTSRCGGITYILSMMALRVSLGFFFLKLFVHRKAQIIIIKLVMASSVVFGLVYIPLGFLTCAVVKVSSGFLSSCPQSLQTASSAFFGIFSVVSILGDLVFVLISCYAIWGAMMPISTKISASVLLIIACMGCVASAIRFGLVVTPADPSDYTQGLINIYLWCMVETSVCVTAANMVMTRPLFSLLLAGSDAADTTEAEDAVIMANSIRRLNTCDTKHDEYGRPGGVAYSNDKVVSNESATSIDDAVKNCYNLLQHSDIHSFKSFPGDSAIVA